MDLERARAHFESFIRVARGGLMDGGDGVVVELTSGLEGDALRAVQSWLQDEPFRRVARRADDALGSRRVRRAASRSSISRRQREGDGFGGGRLAIAGFFGRRGYRARNQPGEAPTRLIGRRYAHPVAPSLGPVTLPLFLGPEVAARVMNDLDDRSEITARSSDCSGSRCASSGRSCRCSRPRRTCRSDRRASRPRTGCASMRSHRRGSNSPRRSCR